MPNCCYIVHVQRLEECLVQLEREGVVVMDSDHSMVNVQLNSMDTIDFLSRIVTPVLITAFLICTWLLDFMPAEMTVSGVASAVQNYNIVLIKEGDSHLSLRYDFLERNCLVVVGYLLFYETLNKETIKNIIIAFINMRVLSQDKKYWRKYYCLVMETAHFFAVSVPKLSVFQTDRNWKRCTRTWVHFIDDMETIMTRHIKNHQTY